jgi:hypothetical protein
MKDLDLLRRFEPVLRYTHGELFFPCAVDEYVQRCSLWLRDPNESEFELLSANKLTIEHLGDFGEIPPGHTLYMRFVQEPLAGTEFQRWLWRDDLPRFQTPGRLARVGMTSRFLSSAFNISLLLRGIVPGGTTAAAHLQYEAMQAVSPQYAYYGRVIREGGYIVLHYMFFYAMNNWRSSYFGVNDHEADWEQVFVYLSENADSTGYPIPIWVAYAAHDFHGDDLRRRWDDPELQKVNDTHPVVYVGAGSHASYFEPGEYLMNLQPRFLLPAKNAVQEIRQFWSRQLGQGNNGRLENQVDAAFSVPFVDYARGDGPAIGPYQDHEWTPILLTEDMGWAHHYRGLWGLDTRDQFGGERAPSGPKFQRDGTMRKSWHNPLGWAGLHKVAPPGMAVDHLRRGVESRQAALRELEHEIAGQRHDLRQIELEVRALKEIESHSRLYRRRQEQLGEGVQELDQLYQRRAEITESLHASRLYLSQIENNSWGDPQAHIRHKHRPEPPLGRQSYIIDLWAAVSSGLLLVSFALLLVFDLANWIFWVIGVLVMFVAIESTLQGRLANLLLNLTIALAVVTAVILMVEFFWMLVLIVILAISRQLIVDNLRELRRR